MRTTFRRSYAALLIGGSVRSQALEQPQGGDSWKRRWAGAWVREQTAGLETTLWSLSLCAGSQASFLILALLQIQLRKYLLHGCFPSNEWSANQRETTTKKSSANLIEVNPFLITPANLIKSTLSSSFCFLMLPCIHTRKQTNWRNNKNNEHSELRLAFTWLAMKAIKAAWTRRVLNFLSQ